MSWERVYKPTGLYPAPCIFPLAEQCPEEIAVELRKAFSLFWGDSAACANRLRVAVEQLLNDQRIVKTVINTNNKRVGLTLHARIDKFKKVDPQAANYLKAIKWLGNAGSHAGLDAVDDVDLLNGFELIEHVIERIYLKRDKRLQQIASDLSKRKGKPKRKK